MKTALLVFSFISEALIFEQNQVFAQEMPTVIDLKSAYCIRVNLLQAQDFGNSSSAGDDQTVTAIRQSVRQKLNENDARLRAYLVPRIFNLDPIAMNVAADRASADFKLWKAEFEEKLRSCNIGKSVEETRACLRSDSETLKRLKSCSDLSWLPF